MPPSPRASRASVSSASLTPTPTAQGSTITTPARPTAAPQAASGDQAVAELAGKIAAVVEKTPKYYSELAEQFADYDFQTVARALGKLHGDGRLWQDPRGRMCLRDSPFAAKPPVKSA